MRALVIPRQTPMLDALPRRLAWTKALTVWAVAAVVAIDGGYGGHVLVVALAGASAFVVVQSRNAIARSVTSVLDRQRYAPRAVASGLPWFKVFLVWSIAAGAAVANGYAIYLLAVTLMGVGILVGIANWRWSIYCLLAYIPISGIPIILAYPNTTGPVLIKDILFVLPAYLGYAGHALKHRRRGAFPNVPVTLFVLFTLLVLAQMLNPNLPNHLVGAIGAKVWLLYIPLVFLGYDLVRSRADLARVLTVISIGALLPSLVGVIEAIMVYGGKSDLVYGYYGDAAVAVSQNFAQLSFEGGNSLRRIPSLFSFHTQYYNFVAAMVAIVYAWRRLVTDGTRYQLLGRAAWLLVLAAALTNGARGAFLLVPALVVLILVIESGIRISPLTVAAPVLAFVGAASVFGIAGRTLIETGLDLARHNFMVIFVDGFRAAMEFTWTGLGTGINTSQSRYAFETPELFTAVEGRWHESWYVKAWLELGAPGLVLILLIFGTIAIRGFRAHRTIRDPGMRAVSAALLTFLLWTMLYSTKAHHLDFDPINVYFWLVAGILVRIGLAERHGWDEVRPRTERDGQPPWRPR